MADEIKKWIRKGDFFLTEAVAPIPGPESGYAFRPLKERPVVDGF